MLIRSLVATVLVFQACLAVPFGLKPRITDGEDATPGEFPYQVSIQWGVPPFIPYNHACGGSILNENYVLTAGHCIMKIGKLKVFAGKHYLLKDETTQQEVEVQRAYVHENYPGGIAPYDIAILKLKTPLILNKRVSAVHLPKQDEVRTGNAVLSGWGSVSKELLPVLPEVLQKVTVPLLDNKSCQNKFPKDIVGTPKVYDTMICTDAVRETSACSGDSGGPLVQIENNVSVQIGVVSWGVYPCGFIKLPSVYTRVASYTNWINNIINYKMKLFVELSSNSNMFPKAIVFFALLALAVTEKLHLGFRMPPIYPPYFRPITPQIVGGEEAPEGGYPYIVSLQISGQHFCAGSIINKDWVMTAAHCVEAVSSPSSLRVVAGKHNIMRTEDSEQTVRVSEMFKHERYGGGVGPYDIGLLRLQSSLEITDRVQPIELAEPESDPTGEAWLSGWGSTSRGIFPDMPDKLQQVQMEYVDRDTCYEAVLKLTGSSPVHETNVCTGPLHEGISACSGDSGGPLISRIGGKPIQTGIVSWGIIPCGSDGAPSVYCRVSVFIDWINNIITNN
ncbi:LOW QUALITY PROTEIN: transmembrane protease serine 9-like [Pogonomyrmex barbatus]|uniref:chymotrypsin n=1 Tax=Pogonomyrmex barbatus TaxID=144034 RepID=A0A6I9VV54_9HYME|nr:LOW QUALITY PROTEIN: transmembrane protease serine 9-like [Pogonomyrmex barbatus]